MFCHLFNAYTDKNTVFLTPIAKKIMNANFEMVAKTLYGFEELLEKELLQLGAQKIKRGVTLLDAPAHFSVPRARPMPMVGMCSLIFSTFCSKIGPKCFRK